MDDSVVTIICPFCYAVLDEPEQSQHKNNGTTSYQCLKCQTCWTEDVDNELQKALDLLDPDNEDAEDDCMLAGSLDDFARLEEKDGFLEYF